jgi:hypothetical protein
VHDVPREVVVKARRLAQCVPQLRALRVDTQRIAR